MSRKYRYIVCFKNKNLSEGNIAFIIEDTYQANIHDKLKQMRETWPEHEFGLIRENKYA